MLAWNRRNITTNNPSLNPSNDYERNAYCRNCKIGKCDCAQIWMYLYVACGCSINNSHYHHRCNFPLGFWLAHWKTRGKKLTKPNPKLSHLLSLTYMISIVCMYCIQSFILSSYCLHSLYTACGVFYILLNWLIDSSSFVGSSFFQWELSPINFKWGEASCLLFCCSLSLCCLFGLWLTWMNENPSFLSLIFFIHFSWIGERKRGHEKVRKKYQNQLFKH